MLMLRVWHPETTETERAAIQFIFDCMADEALVGTNEQVFAYPGLGQATVAAGLRSDVPLLLAIALFTALFVSVGNLIADGLYQWADPRIARDRTNE